MAKRTAGQLVLPGFQRCSRCRQILPASSFRTNRHRASGLQDYCKPCMKAYQAEYYAKNAARMKANATARQRNNPRYREYQRGYFKRNREHLLARNRNRAAEKREAYRPARVAYRKLNADRYRRLSRLYKLRKRGASVGRITVELLAAKFAYWGDRCWMCGGEWTDWDHVKPISKGGLHCLANLRPACRSCNKAKFNRWPFPTHRRR